MYDNKRSFVVNVQETDIKNILATFRWEINSQESAVLVIVRHINTLFLNNQDISKRVAVFAWQTRCASFSYTWSRRSTRLIGCAKIFIAAFCFTSRIGSIKYTRFFTLTTFCEKGETKFCPLIVYTERRGKRGTIRRNFKVDSHWLANLLFCYRIQVSLDTSNSFTEPSLFCLYRDAQDRQSKGVNLHLA